MQLDNSEPYWLTAFRAVIVDGKAHGEFLFASRRTEDTQKGHNLVFLGRWALCDGASRLDGAPTGVPCPQVCPNSYIAILTGA
jgi:hypothetical protein